MHGRYYVLEHDLSSLQLRHTRESEKAANTAHTKEIENMDHIDEVFSLVDVAYDES